MSNKNLAANEVIIKRVLGEGYKAVIEQSKLSLSTCCENQSLILNNESYPANTLFCKNCGLRIGFNAFDSDSEIHYSWDQGIEWRSVNAMPGCKISGESGEGGESSRSIRSRVGEAANKYKLKQRFEKDFEISADCFAVKSESREADCCVVEFFRSDYDYPIAVFANVTRVILANDEVQDETTI